MELIYAYVKKQINSRQFSNLIATDCMLLSLTALIHFPVSKNNRRARILLLCCCFIWTTTLAQEKIWLAPQTVPDTEAQTKNTPIGKNIVYNVSRPSLTLYRPDTANGIAVIIIPGGAMQVLNIEHEGSAVAHFLIKKGFTVFVLQHRLLPVTTNDPWNEMLRGMKDSAVASRKATTVSPLAREDVAAAMRYVRDNAGSYGLLPKRLGVMGFSSGGSFTQGLCQSADSTLRPDFAALIYNVNRMNSTDLSKLPPVFIAGATDDVLAQPSHSIAIYTAWTSAGRPAELHLFAKGGHGLHGPASMFWKERLLDWMTVQGLWKPK